MIFQTTNAIAKIIAGTKTQTRRIVKPGDYAFTDTSAEPARIVDVWSAKRRMKWHVGNTYLIQPGRGKTSVWWNPATNELAYVESNPMKGALSSMGYCPLQIRILSIRQGDVRDIGFNDAKAEGYDLPYSFLMAWITMHDKTLDKTPYEQRMYRVEQRPAERYLAWRLEFEVVK